MKRVFLSLAVMLMLAGCSGPNHGRIADKHHQEQYTYYVNQCVSYNSKGFCSVYILQPYINPESWAFDLYVSKDDHGWYSVDEATFNRYKVGDFFSAEAVS